MKTKISKGVIALVLAVSLLVAPPVQQAEAAMTALSAISMVVGLLQALQAAVGTAIEQANARATIVNTFALTALPGSSSYMYRISADELYSAVASFNNNGLPCEVVDVSWNGSTIRAIKCTNEPYKMYDGTRLIPSNNIKNHYYSPGGYFLYAIGDDSSYSLYFIRSTINTISGWVNTINTNVSSMSSNIQLITTALTNSSSVLLSYLSNISSYTNAIKDYVDGVESSLSTIVSNTNNLSTIATNTTHNYYVGYGSDTNNVDFPRQPIPWESAYDIVAYLNNTFNHGSIQYLSVNNVLGAQKEFKRAYLSTTGYIQVVVVDGGQDVTYLLVDKDHYVFQANAGYNNPVTSIIGYIDGIESTLSTISSRVNTTNTRLNTIIGHVDTLETGVSGIIDALGPNGAIVSAINSLSSNSSDYSSEFADVLAQLQSGVWVTSYNTYSSSAGGETYPTISLRPDTCEQIVAYMNSHYMGQEVKYLSRDNDFTPVDNSYYFAGSWINTNTNRIQVRIERADGTNLSVFLCTPQHYIYLEDGTYVSQSDFYAKLSSIETALYGETETRSTALVPVGETALSILGSFETALTPLGTIGTILTVANDILDVIDDWTADPNYTQVLNQINSKLSVTVDSSTYSLAQLEYASAQRLNDIYLWLDNNNLLNDQYVIAVLQNYGSYVTDAVDKYDNIINLFDEAWLLRLPQWTTGEGGSVLDDFGDVVDYFRDFYGEGQYS